MTCSQTQTQACQSDTVITRSLSFLSAVEELNRVVSEAFLHFFVKTVGHYASYVKRGRAGEQGVFEKRSFYKAIESKTTRHFVKKFIQTQMFDLFIQDVEQQQAGPQQGEDTHTRSSIIMLYDVIEIVMMNRVLKKSHNEKDIFVTVQQCEYLCCDLFLCYSVGAVGSVRA